MVLFKIIVQLSSKTHPGQQQQKKSTGKFVHGITVNFLFLGKILFQLCFSRQALTGFSSLTHFASI